MFNLFWSILEALRGLSVAVGGFFKMKKFQLLYRMFDMRTLKFWQFANMIDVCLIPHSSVTHNSPMFIFLSNRFSILLLCSVKRVFFTRRIREVKTTISENNALLLWLQTFFFVQQNLKRTTSEQISFDLECSRNPSALLNNIL